MRCLVLSCLLFYVCSVCLQAQVSDKSNELYHSLIMDGTCEWFTSYYGLQTTVISSEDTIIQNKTYKKIYLRKCGFENNGQEYHGAIREEDKRVFVVYEDDKEGKEILLYDFNMKVGDRITYKYLDDLEFELARIDKVEIEGVGRKQYHFYLKNNAYPGEIYPYDSWIEGIGSEQDLIYPFFPLCTCIGGNSRVLCVHRNGDILYKETVNGLCSCNEAQSVEKKSANSTFRILENPVKDKKLMMELSGDVFTKIDIYSLDGRLQLSQGIFRGENEVLEISLGELLPGNYILILSRKDNSRESDKIVVL